MAAFPAASAAGVAMLRTGGNAIDAACAAAWALAVCEPAESGLGGQTTMLIRLSSGRTVVIDGHSRAPASLRRGKCGRRSQRMGHRATTVPSTPATLAAAQSRYGVRTLADAITPAISLAEEGYRVTALQRRLFKWCMKSLPKGSCIPALFGDADGQPPAVGSLLRQPRLASTLRRLQNQGIGDFYTGETSRRIVDDIKNNGGFLASKDLSRTGLPVEREPLSITYGHRRIVSVPPPGGGVQVLLALRILEGIRTNSADPADWEIAMIRATHAAFRERERWPDHPDDVTPSLARWLVSAERAAGLIARINTPAVPGAPPPDTLGESGNTTHLCAADSAGNVVSLTQSIQSVFGAKVAHPELGFVYNNYLSTCPRSPHPYRLGPGCLPQSNAAPTIVLEPDGTSMERPVLALGSAGSRRITSSTVQVMSAVLDRDLSLASAVAMPRAHALLSGTVWFEPGLPGATLQRIRSLFPKLRALSEASYKMGAVQAIAWDRSGRITAAADPRRDGAAAFA